MSNRKYHSKLWPRFVGLIFMTIFVVFTLITMIWIVLFKLNVIQISPNTRHIPIVISALGSLLLGSVIAIYVGKWIVRPVENIGHAFDELSHIETLRNDFVANVSHEFKTPIAAIEGYATLLQNHNLSKEKADHYIEKILENSQRLAKLSGNILTLSKLENQEMVLRKSEYRLDEQIRKAILLLENKWSEKELEFDLELPKVSYYGSESLLEQVWVNLLDNAIKHAPAGSEIHICIWQKDTEFTVSISDNGSGMSDEIQKHIFEKFYQGDPSRKAEGNGLGLALVKRIIELCKGTIEVESVPGNGATFTVVLPVEKRKETA